MTTLSRSDMSRHTPALVVAADLLGLGNRDGRPTSAAPVAELGVADREF